MTALYMFPRGDVQNEEVGTKLPIDVKAIHLDLKSCQCDCVLVVYLRGQMVVSLCILKTASTLNLPQGTLPSSRHAT